MRVAADDRAEALASAIRGIRRVGVEVGVYKGWLSSRLLALDPALILYMVDPWRAKPVEEYRDNDDFHARMSQNEHDAVMAEAVAAVEPYGNRARIIRSPSVDAAKHFNGYSLDFAFIDGDHCYEACRDDIAAWWPKIKVGGFLSGHDYRDDKHPGVKQAVHEWLGDRELRLGANYTWFVTRGA